MSVVIRLKRMGKKKQPFYRIVVQDSRCAPVGNVIEELGVYDPTRETPVMRVKQERVQEWLKRGARPSDTVRTLLAAAAKA